MAGGQQEAAAAANKFKGYSSRWEYYLYSGDPKCVAVGIAVFAAVFAVPWYYMTRGKKLFSHQDYMERAEKARKERLSTGSKGSE